MLLVDDLHVFVFRQRRLREHRLFGFLAAAVGRDDIRNTLESALAEVAVRHRKLRFVRKQREVLIAAGDRTARVREAVE